jgi:hypothetical protein
VMVAIIRSWESLSIIETPVFLKSENTSAGGPPSRKEMRCE